MAAGKRVLCLASGSPCQATIKARAWRRLAAVACGVEWAPVRAVAAAPTKHAPALCAHVMQDTTQLVLPCTSYGPVGTPDNSCFSTIRIQGADAKLAFDAQPFWSAVLGKYYDPAGMLG